MTRKRALLAAVAALLLLCGLGVAGAASSSTTPLMLSGHAQCATDTAGKCTVGHTLGVVPTGIVLTPWIPDSQSSYMLSVVSGTPTASSFVIKARTASGTAAAKRVIAFGYVVTADPSAPPPTTATTTTSVTSTIAPTTTTEPPSTTTPPATTTTDTTPAGVPAVGSYVKPGSVGYQGPMGDLTVITKSQNIPPQCHWDAGEYAIACVGDLTLDHVWVKGGIYWDSDGTLTVRDSVVDSGDGKGKWTVRGFDHSNCLVDIEDSTLRWAVPHESTMQAASVLTDCRQKMIRNDVSGGDSGFIFYRDGDQAVGNYIHDFRLVHGLSHNDGIFVGGGANVLIQQNYVDVGWDGDCQTAALFWQGSGMTGNRVYANYLAGGGYTVANEAAPAVDFRNNTFGDADYGSGDPMRKAQFGLSSTRGSGSFSASGNVKTSGGGYSLS